MSALTPSRLSGPTYWSVGPIVPDAVWVVSVSGVWCVGQGGTGIQTAPGAGRPVADLIEHRAPGSTFDGLPIDLPGVLPDRFG